MSRVGGSNGSQGSSELQQVRATTGDFNPRELTKSDRKIVDIRANLIEILKDRGVEVDADDARIDATAEFLAGLKNNTSLSSAANKARQLGLAELVQNYNMAADDGAPILTAATADTVFIEGRLTGQDRKEALFVAYANSLYMALNGGPDFAGDFGGELYYKVTGRGGRELPADRPVNADNPFTVDWDENKKNYADNQVLVTRGVFHDWHG